MSGVADQGAGSKEQNEMRQERQQRRGPKTLANGNVSPREGGAPAMGGVAAERVLSTHLFGLAKEMESEE